MHPLLAPNFQPRWSTFTAESIEPSIRQALAEAQQAIDTISNQAPDLATYPSSFLALENATESLSRGWGRLQHLDSVCDNPAQREAINKLLPEVTDFYSSLSLNPRLFADQLVYIINHAGDQVIFADTSFVPLLAQIAPAIQGNVRTVVLMTDAANMPDLALPASMALHCYEDLMAAADEDFTWPVFEENTAAALCYTSGTTGRPKGALYSHRSTILHAYAVSMPDVLGLRAVDRILPVVPMFHVNAWEIGRAHV